MKPFTKEVAEQDLIAYHLNELSPLRRAVVRRALERNPALAAESESIAATLRAFAADSADTPQVDDALLDRTWQRVRPSLAVLTPQVKQHKPWRWAAAGFVAALLVVATATVSLHRQPQTRNVAQANAPTADQPAIQTAPATPEQAQQVIAELQSKAVKPHAYNNRPGPLTTAPSGAATADAALAAHMDSAERLLTQVSHAEGPLPAETRSEAHRLLLANAVYRNAAQARGDLTTASVMDDLGRVLISLDAAPPETAQSVDALRMQMNVGGVLFDLRILHYNKASSANTSRPE